MSKPLVLMAALLLVVACGGATPSIPEPTPTATPIPTPEPAPTTTPIPTPELTPTTTPIPTPEPTPTTTPIPTPEPTPKTTPTATPLPPAEQTERLRHLGDPRLTDIREKMESVEPVWTVYFHSQDWLTPGRNTLINDVFELVKLENIATHDGYKEVSPETIVALEPDIIVADSIESVIGNPDSVGPAHGSGPRPYPTSHLRIERRPLLQL